MLQFLWGRHKRYYHNFWWVTTGRVSFGVTPSYCLKSKYFTTASQFNKILYCLACNFFFSKIFERHFGFSNREMVSLRLIGALVSVLAMVGIFTVTADRYWKVSGDFQASNPSKITLCSTKSRLWTGTFYHFSRWPMEVLHDNASKWATWCKFWLLSKFRRYSTNYATSCWNNHATSPYGPLLYHRRGFHVHCPRCYWHIWYE